MAFTVPRFNITVNVFTGPWLTKTLRVADLAANFAIGRREQQAGNDFINASSFQPESGLTAFLLLPSGSDVRSQSNGGGVQDVIEIPSGSNCWYQCTAWEDMAMGFPNQYRMAAVAKIWEELNPIYYAGCVWPVPTPARA